MKTILARWTQGDLSEYEFQALAWFSISVSGTSSSPLTAWGIAAAAALTCDSPLTAWGIRSRYVELPNMNVHETTCWPPLEPTSIAHASF